MTSFKIECPNCGRMYNLAEKFRGRKVTCASEACGTSFLASPLPDEELGDLNEEDPPSQKPVPSEQPEHVLPPPLQRPRTPLQMPRKTGSKRLVIVLATALGVILTTAISMVILMGSRNVSVQNLAQTKSEKKSTNEILREQILKLLGLTDTTIRLMKETSDPQLAREYINQWSEIRNGLTKNDQSELGLEVIEGQLNAIHQRLYPRKTGWSYLTSHGWRSALESSENEDSVDAIRIAQGQIMKSYKIPWKETQIAQGFQEKYDELRKQGQEIAATSKLNKDGLPAPLSSSEASNLISRLEILYAKVPYDTTLLDHETTTDPFKCPSILHPDRYIFELAASVIYTRSQIPLFEDNLAGKTKLLSFSQQYLKTLSFLEEIVR